MERDVRRLLLGEAVRVIAKNGEQALRTKAVAAAAGVTEPALFHYFGSREGLIEEAQAERFKTLQVDLIKRFRDNVMQCNTKKEFVAVVRATIEAVNDPVRAPSRATRIHVAGSAVTRPNLAARLVVAQKESNAVLVDALAYAQRRKWIRANLNVEAFAMWFIGHATGRFFAEMDPNSHLLPTIDAMMAESTLAVLGLSGSGQAKI